jgi:hypothetical protein
MPASDQPTKLKILSTAGELLPIGITLGEDVLPRSY